ncbi:hypothetical protein AR457_00515 [Streptomyces agglomeratus]|uniref:Uncharacterized protein n=1 Tax=Streptomyces agglomeratus TaxID=285458 RepID=A0A1E5P124_9ACTN|nr:hypothetical protein [Streptomyces agglomeratus]OEJ23253.1 hypothetical protein AS594_00720 [Streptomyces agglomeratus]OEJ42828.1 hypothetical protein AR457_00515 [Streptomyces agglomeratus]OEJ55243.1 hypothetical protein BGK72_35195 [Streptomyces agglomeratus]
MWMGLDKKEVKDALEGVMPWLAPTGKLTVEALSKLDRPLLAWAPESQAYLFDSADFYADYTDEPGGMSPLEKKIAKLPPRREWKMERVWTPHEESDEEHEHAHEKASVTIGGRLLHPRDLDAYATFAYEYAGLEDEDDFTDAEDGTPGLQRVTGDLTRALAWAAAGVCVLQQSLPHPFRDVMLYGETDNRPAHRILFAYASLLRIKHPRKAAPWFTALVYLNPMDNVGARFLAPGGPTYQSTHG